MKLGLVLSGGAVRGATHIGILKALDEYKIPVCAISGVSAGAIVGAFYANGYTAKQIEKIALKTNFLKFFKPSIPFKSLFSLEEIEKFLSSYIKNYKLENSQLRLFITTTNLNEGNYQIWEEGNLYKLVRASSSLPFWFEPVEINGNLHVDGGLTNNLPVEPLKSTCDYIIAVDVNPLSRGNISKNILSITIRSFYLSVRANVEARKNLADIFIQPERLKTIGLFDIRKIKDAIDIGYEEGIKLAKTLQSII